MNVFRRMTGMASSPHTGKAMRLVKVLNFVGTVRGAITTVLLAASAIGGGAVTVNQVRHERAETPRATVARTASPTVTPLTAAALEADITRRMQAALAADAQAADDLRKVAVFSGPRLDQLIDETKQRLQSRYDLGLTQIATMLGTAPVPSGSPAPSGSSVPTASPSIIAANALFQVIVNDLNAIVVSATRAATEPTPLPRSLLPTVAPTPAPTIVPRTPSPSPSHSPSASPRPSATR